MNELDFVKPLLLWYNRDKRDLPWRHTRDPYRIWVSEIMLQQTRAETVTGYYDRFLEALPDVKALAGCPDDDLMKLWEGLGYYSRARNLKKATREIVSECDGHFPSDYDSIRALPGIGEYTAGAVSSIAFGLNEPAVDGNVLRVAARFRGSEENILSGRFKKAANGRLRTVMRKAAANPDISGLWYAGDFNQALIELGALVCIPNGTPKCDRCPLMKGCTAFREKTWDRIPVRKKPTKHRIEERTVLVIWDGNHAVLDKRPGTGLLAGMYEFPNTEGHISEQEAVDRVRGMGLLPTGATRLQEAKHIFSHITWKMIGYEIRIDCASGESGENGLIFADREALVKKYALPSAFSAYEKELLRKTAPSKAD